MSEQAQTIAGSVLIVLLIVYWLVDDVMRGRREWARKERQRAKERRLWRELHLATIRVWPTDPIAADPDPSILQQLIESGRAEVKR